MSNEKEKTAMQILRKNLTDKLIEGGLTPDYRLAIGDVIEFIDEEDLINTKEREQFIEAYNQGRSDSKSETAEDNDRTGIRYFTERFES